MFICGDDLYYSSETTAAYQHYITLLSDEDSNADSELELQQALEASLRLVKNPACLSAISILV